MESSNAYRNDILEYAKEKYKIEADFPWAKFPKYAVLRHKDNSKWFALISDVQKKKLAMDGEEKIDIINVKCDPMLIGSLRSEKGFLPAYHMNKENWITILLDGSVDRKEIYKFIDLSYNMTKKKCKNKTK